MLHTLLKLFKPIYLYSGSYSFAAPILQMGECLSMSSHARTSCSHKSKNPRENNEDSVGVNLTPRNSSKP